jgi:branched-subunit amino acid ABC-type transport system permease component
MDFVVVQVLNGLSWSGLLFTMASGLSIVFGVMGVLNLSHGALYMLGAYGLVIGGTILGFWGAIPVVLVLLFGIGIVVEALFFRPLYGRAVEYQLLLTFGLVLVFEDLAKMIWGRTPISIGTPELLKGSIAIMGKTYPIYGLFTLVIGGTLAFLVWWITNKTRFGMLIRAASTDRDMTSALGINTKFLYTAVFAFGAALAGLGGALSAPIYTAYPTLGSAIILQVFIIIVIGRMGSLEGAALGSLIVGMLQTMLVGYFPRFGVVATFAIATLVLVVRPRGLWKES